MRRDPLQLLGVLPPSLVSWPCGWLLCCCSAVHAMLHCDPSTAPSLLRLHSKQWSIWEMLHICVPCMRLHNNMPQLSYGELPGRNNLARPSVQNIQNCRRYTYTHPLVRLGLTYLPLRTCRSAASSSARRSLKAPAAIKARYEDYTARPSAAKLGE